MGTRVVLGVWTLDFPEGGGHAWAYLNWALGLRALGCDVVWMEPRPENGDLVKRLSADRCDYEAGLPLTLS